MGYDGYPFIYYNLFIKWYVNKCNICNKWRDGIYRQANNDCHVPSPSMVLVYKTEL